ncbi:MAG: OsmC family protein, partial [Trichococcus flocculiformis]
YSGLSVTVEGTFDPRGVAGEDDIRTYFQEVTLVNHIVTDETDEAIEKLATEVERRCPVYNLMLDAGVDMSTQWIRTN